MTWPAFLRYAFIAFSVIDIVILIDWGLEHWRKPGEHDDKRDGRRLVLLGLCGAITFASGELRERYSDAQVTDLETRLAPRSLDPAHRAALKKALQAASPKGTITISCVAGDRDSCPFAEQWEALLNEAGWPTESREGVTYMGKPTPIGIAVGVASRKDAPPYVEAFMNACIEAGIRIPYREGGILLGPVVLEAGVKP
jgi:hypothetical protein